MLSIGPMFVLSLVVFAISVWVVAFEQKKNQRLFLSELRGHFDAALQKIVAIIVIKLNYLGRHIIKMSWYYSIHKILRFILTALVKTYDYLEEAFMRNRDRARKLKTEKRNLVQNHLGQMAEHKAATTLNDSQKKKLLQKKLERG